MRFLSRNFATLTIDLKRKTIEAVFYNERRERSNLTRVFDASAVTRVDIVPSRGNKWLLNIAHQLHLIFVEHRIEHIVLVYNLKFKKVFGYVVAGLGTLFMLRYVARTFKH